MAEKTYILRGAPTAAPVGTLALDERLNPQQRAVVESPRGVALVLAGAGSGKTRTLTHRVAWLVQHGIAVDGILLLTFTNRAAKEMLTRVQDLLSIDVRRIWGGTFHSIARRMLREYGTLLGYPDTFGILDREDAETLMRSCIAELPDRDRSRRFPRPSTLLDLISSSVNTGAAIETLLLERFPQFAEHLASIETCALAYVSRKLEYGVMDFDDLLLQLVRLLREHSTVRERFQRQFHHVLVDEFQDTNRIQAEIVDLLHAETGSLMVVGDDFQSIYSFRGAHFRNIIDFPSRYPDAHVHLLEENYRSSPQIVALANASIARNQLQFDKHLFSNQPPGPLPAAVRCRDADQQAAFLAARVLELRDEGSSLDQIAVLYRAHWQSMEVQVEFNRAGIPYVVRSGVRFFEQKHVKDVLAFLRFLANPRDELSFQRLVMLSDGVGAGTARKLFLWVQAQPSLGDALRNPEMLHVAGRRASPGVTSIARVLATLDEQRTGTAAAAVQAVQSFYTPYAERTFDNARNRLRELDTLAAYADRNGTIEEFLDSLALDTSGVDTASVDEDRERVVLTTVHQAKGLEFDAVFVIGLADEKFPSVRSMHNDDDYEEERRLFYVACTRARRQLHLSWPMIHHDRMEGRVLQRPSPFVTELETHTPPLFEMWKLVGDG